MGELTQAFSRNLHCTSLHVYFCLSSINLLPTKYRRGQPKSRQSAVTILWHTALSNVPIYSRHTTAGKSRFRSILHSQLTAQFSSSQAFKPEFGFLFLPSASVLRHLVHFFCSCNFKNHIFPVWGRVMSTTFFKKKYEIILPHLCSSVQQASPWEQWERAGEHALSWLAVLCWGALFFF